MATATAHLDQINADHQQNVNGQLLSLDQLTFMQCFDKVPFKVRHKLSEHPLFALSRLMELSRNLPAHLVEYNAGDLTVNHDPAITPMNGLSIEETIDRIETCRSWMVLKYVDSDPAYKDLLQSCLNEIKCHSERIDPGMCQPEAYIFISSPHSVTPFHVDPEHNFLLQIRGSKTIHIWDRNDTTVMPEQAWQRYYLGSHRNQHFEESFQTRAEKFTLEPGDGVHVPVVAPHWVHNGPQVSISFSITFRTPATKRKNAVNRLNADLIKRGFHVSPYGKSIDRDRLKYVVFSTQSAIRRNQIVQFARRALRYCARRLKLIAAQ